jgi:hypothetical protein
MHAAVLTDESLNQLKPEAPSRFEVEHPKVLSELGHVD